MKHCNGEKVQRINAVANLPFLHLREPLFFLTLATLSEKDPTNFPENNENSYFSFSTSNKRDESSELFQEKKTNIPLNSNKCIVITVLLAKINLNFEVK